MTHLTPQAEQALQAVRDKHKEYKERKALIEAEVRATLQDRLNTLREERDGAIRLAVEAGVPRTRLGEAIGTSNYRTIQEILASTENMVRQSDGWALVKTGGNSYTLQVTALGVGRVSGSAQIKIEDGDIEFLDGDQFVLPTIYREGLAEDVIASA